MEWWQQALVTFGAVIVGGGITFLVQRKIAKEDRAAKHKTEICNAMRGLLVEIDENIELAQQDPIGIRVLFPTYMWEGHRERVGALPLTLRDNLSKAYSYLKKANTVAQTAFAYAEKYRVGDWDTRYVAEVKKAEPLLHKAREALAKWLVEEGCDKLKSG
jgi:hypothetical protein